MLPDPDMEFRITAAGWTPVAIQHVIGTFRRAHRGPAQAELADFAELWARNIESQGWLTESVLEIAHEGRDPA
jgi:hypothetical protein